MKDESTPHQPEQPTGPGAVFRHLAKAEHDPARVASLLKLAGVTVDGFYKILAAYAAKHEDGAEVMALIDREIAGPFMETIGSLFDKPHERDWGEGPS